MNRNVSQPSQPEPDPFTIPSKELHNHEFNGQGCAWGVPMPFRANFPGPRPLTAIPQNGLEQRASFEGLLLSMLADFVRVPVNALDQQIGCALREVCMFSEMDRARVWRRSSSVAASFRLAVQHPDPATPTVSPEHAALNGNGNRHKYSAGLQPLMQVEPEMESCTLFPWITEQVMHGKIIAFGNLTELPAAAAQDQETLTRLGVAMGTIIPFSIQKEVSGFLSFESLRTGNLPASCTVRRLEIVAQILAEATARKIADEALTRSYVEIKQLKDRLQAESEYLKTEIKVNQAHGHIIGRGQGIKKVLHQVEQVAPADCAVLINGETGTGKELIAQEIHRLSARRDRVMVLVNCAALPSALVESELFGRERGAYTGALTSQVGRFEMANGSTIFLDEVGELSMEVQAKLLRVLQQGEFQRLGSPKTHKVNVRVIAATNRDLAAEVRSGKFREDLYYRLKVFPIEVPPLRQRVEDIALLAFAFMEEFSARMGKKITKVPRKAMDALQRYAWPGNIRELRNVIEHSVILSSGDMLKLSALGDAPTRESEPVTLAEAEREHILRTLESTGWRIKGPHGAAQRLALHSSTLYSRMQKLGIPHRRQKDEMAPDS